MTDYATASVAGVVLRNEEGKYLLVQERQPRAYGLWNLPAGIVEDGDSLAETAIREAKEEVGFDVELIDDKPLLSQANKSQARTLNSFSAKITSGQLTPQKTELLDAKWLTFTEIRELEKRGKIRDPWVVDSIKKFEREK